MFTLPLLSINTVLFPGMPMHLHVYEEEYRLMVQKAISTDHLLGVVYQNTEPGTQPFAPSEIGCIAHIIHIDPLPNGQIDLIAVGLDRFRIFQIMRRYPFALAKVDVLLTESPRTLEIVRGANLLRTMVKSYIQCVTSAGNNGEIESIQDHLHQFQLPEDPTLLIFMACEILQLPAYEKQKLLEILSAPQLLRTILRIYRREQAIHYHISKTSWEVAQGLTELN